MKANETKSVQVTFTLNKEHMPPPPRSPKQQLTQAEDVKYLSIHLDRTLAWRKQIPERENNWSSNSANCTGSLAENCNYHWITSYWYTKQS